MPWVVLRPNSLRLSLHVNLNGEQLEGAKLATKKATAQTLQRWLSLFDELVSVLPAAVFEHEADDGDQSEREGD